MIIVKPYSDDFKQRWNEFADRQPDSTVAHAIGFRKVIEKGLGHRPVYLMALEDNEIRGILPLFLVTTMWRTKYLISIPWLDYGGILAETPEAAAALLKETENLKSKHSAQFVEFRSAEPVYDDLPTKTEKVTFKLKLDRDPEKIWTALDAKLRNQIRKALKSELTTEFGRVDKLPEFYRVFQWKMHQLGTPVWGYGLFEAILNQMGPSAEIILVRRQGEVIAGGLVLSYKNQVYVPSAASYSEHLKLCPNHALYWEVIRRGCESGQQWFDFGRSSVDSNTYRFKKQWVAQPTQLHWQYCLSEGDQLPSVNPNNPKYRLFINLWRKMPLTIANLLGPRVIRNFP